MTQLWDFSGGIHPAENKHQSTSRPITGAGLPEVLVLPLQQHIASRPNPVLQSAIESSKARK